MGKHQDIQENVIIVIRKNEMSAKEWDEIIKILQDMEKEKII
jgi:molybdate-binding protein